MIEIEELRSRRGRRRFVQFQFDLYSGDPVWVPPIFADEVRALDRTKNPGLESSEVRSWLAMRDGDCVGRVAGVINSRDNEMRGTTAARFCLIDFIDDREVSERLVETVTEWARQAGMTRLEGPLGLTTFERSAVLVEGFDRLPTAVSSYNFPYYPAHFEALGFKKQVDYGEHRFRLPRELDPRYLKVASYMLKKKGLQRLEMKSRKKLLARGREIFHLVNAAYSDLYEFTPMSDCEIDALITKFFSFIDPRFVKLVADREGAIVAVGVGMPSLSEGLQAARGRLWPFGFLKLLRAVKRTDTLDLYLIAVKPALRNTGLNAIVMQDMHAEIAKAGMDWVETNGELETNTRVLSMWKDIEHETHKRRRIYTKAI